MEGLDLGSGTVHLLSLRDEAMLVKLLIGK